MPCPRLHTSYYQKPLFRVLRGGLYKNTDKRLFEGKVASTYTPDWKNIKDSSYGGISDESSKTGTGTKTDPIKIKDKDGTDLVIDDITVNNDGEVIATTEDGTEINITDLIGDDGLTSSLTGSTGTTYVEDSNGNVYGITDSPNGPTVTKVENTLCILEKIKDQFLTDNDRKKILGITNNGKVFRIINDNFNVMLDVVGSVNEPDKEVYSHHGWSVRGDAQFSKNKGKVLFERIFEKIKTTQKGKEITYKGLHEKGIYLGKYNLDGIDYKIALYSSNKSPISFTKYSAKDYCDLIENKKAASQVKLLDYNNTLVLVLFDETQNIDFMVQLISDDAITNQDEKFKTLLKWFGILDGAEYVKVSDEEGEYTAKGVNLDKEILGEIFKGTPKEKLKEVANLINKYSDKFEINTPKRMSYFLGQIGHETGGFNGKEAFKEGTCYPASSKSWNIWYNLTWKETPYNRAACSNETINIGKRKNTKWTSIDKVPKKYICGSGAGTKEDIGENLFSYVYRCEGGNGNEASRDGYKYRGHGFMHLTWKKQYEQFDEYLMSKGLPHDYKGILSDPDTAFDDLEIATLSGMWFWQNNNLNDFADENKFEKLCQKINDACDQRQKRIIYTESAKKVLVK